MNFKRTILPYAVSAAALALLFYLDPGSHEHPAPTKGNRVASLIIATACTAMYWALYVGADALRRWRGWAAWTLCPVAAAFCAAITTLVFFAPVEVSGFQRSGDAFYFFGIIFLPSLAFGLSYTALYYDPQHKVA
jgi:hypothetical protein